MPFARYVIENAGKLNFPFRRYQIQKAWRGERPQEGRYREFTQADIDIVAAGELSPHFEAELPLVIADVFSQFPVGDFVIQINNRKICNGFYQGIGLTDVMTVLRIVDKLDKIGPDAVTAQLIEAGAFSEQKFTADPLPLDKNVPSNPLQDTPARSTRRSSSALRTGVRSAPAVAMTRSPRTGARPTPGSASPSA